MPGPSLRLKFSAVGPAAGLNPPALLASLAEAFRSAGLPLAPSAEKRPRPLALLAYPLPPGVEGLGEWADVTLAHPLTEKPADALATLRDRCPVGLDMLGLEKIPHYASPVNELCESAHWVWLCPETVLPRAVRKMAAFAAAPSFRITKTGKEGGKKTAKEIEVRHLVKEMLWKGAELHFSTATLQGHALNPQKLISAVLSSPSEVSGMPGILRRIRVDLGPDPRLSRTDKYAHKLRNLFEDAVLLEAGPGLQVHYDDDDGLIMG